MIRLSILTISIAAMISACSGPIETRVTTYSEAALPTPKHFQYAGKPGQDSSSDTMARELVSAALSASGFKEKNTAPVLVSIALADRPASIAIVAGEDTDVETITTVKERELFQSCEDREHRLTVALFDQVTGANIYTGTAAEYHCKGQFGDSLPYLVRAALSDLGKNVNQNKRSITKTRAGIE